MKRLSLFAILSAVLLSSCEQKSFTNEFSGTIWEGVEISNDMWSAAMGLNPDTSYHRLEFLDFTDDAVPHYYWSESENDWKYRDMFHYDITYGGAINMEWEVTYYGDTLTTRFDVSDDRKTMSAEYDYESIVLRRVK